MIENILNALNANLDTNRDTLPVAWPNVEYVPIQGQPFLEAVFLPTGVSISELGVTGRNYHEGIYQISIRYPANKGHGAAYNTASVIAGAFRRGVIIARGGVNVQIRRVQQEPPIQEQNWFHVPISVSWFAFIGN